MGPAAKFLEPRSQRENYQGVNGDSQLFKKGNATKGNEDSQLLRAARQRPAWCHID
jgi:hypothetical protein